MAKSKRSNASQAQQAGLLDLSFVLESRPEAHRFARSRLSPSRDELRLGEPELSWALSISDGPGAAAMACAALTVVCASFKQAPLLQAAQAAKVLGLKKDALPQGFYVLSEGKIAAGLFPALGGFEQEANAASEAFAELVERSPKIAQEGAFNADLRFDVERLLSSPSNFSHALMLDAPAAQAFERFGFGARTRLLGADGLWGRPWRGYPAFADLGPSPIASAGSSAHCEIPLDLCAGLPIYNHSGHSHINNVRELAEAGERKAARQDIFDSMFERWTQLRLGQNGPDVDGSEPWESTPRERAQAQAKAVERLACPVIGGERQLVCHPDKTSMFVGERSWIASLDWALVDGQHSSVDYALLASAVALPSQAPRDRWPGHALGAKDSSPAQLRRRFASLIKSLGRSRAAQLGAGLKEGALWDDFAAFFARAKTPVRISFEANPANQLQAIKEANNRRPQRPEAMALLERKAEIAQFVELANEQAALVGDPKTLAQTKNLATNPAFAGEGAQNTIEFEKIFPALYAVCRPVDHRPSLPLSTWFGPQDPELALRQSLAKALGLRSNSALLPDLEERARALLDALGSAPAREHRVSIKSLDAVFGSSARSGILDDLAAQAGSGARRVGAAASNRGAFARETSAARERGLDAFGAQAQDAARLIALGAAQSGLSRASRSKLAYAMRSRALSLREAIEQGMRRIPQGVLSTEGAESLMLGVSRRFERKKFGGEESLAPQRIAMALGRVAELAKAGSASCVDGALDSLRALAKAASAEGGAPLDFCSIEPRALATLLDAVPVGLQAQSLASVIKTLDSKARRPRPR